MCDVTNAAVLCISFIVIFLLIIHIFMYVLIGNMG